MKVTKNQLREIIITELRNYKVLEWQPKQEKLGTIIYHAVYVDHSIKPHKLDKFALCGEDMVTKNIGLRKHHDPLEHEKYYPGSFPNGEKRKCPKCVKVIEDKSLENEISE